MNLTKKFVKLIKIQLKLNKYTIIKIIKKKNVVIF